ncbi:serine/threonine protein phosphatase 1 [Aminobacter aminovorans]|uniref:Bis(5'-nucleosyl)-tetraphosphatase PrpE n=1 Tax=Aminobacter aminovorans TaxID=83263 RepID=A0A380WR74_AMIAI|nr:metallophosphoesterase family protein [Aminobacter aminovorans]TCS30482.1 serine/threonine protein phosphatase 1 [Aminobacter aminovorans]SUU91331.1 bis(5'-nucleosyl)-tetraphosphatase PrpE [Aminobacter aminovorans]
MHYLDARSPDGMRVYAIGDIHGHLDLLRDMHERIAGEIARDKPADWRIIHLGDLVDRGPDSSGVIGFLIAAVARDPRNMVLAGNHDVGFLDFLAEPDPVGLFARHGGRETARSYGVDLQVDNAASLARGHSELAAAVPDSHQRFLRALPRSASFGDFFFCHAGIRPCVALDRQDPEDLIWIRNEFLRYPELHPKVVVHGHTPQAEPEVLANRVNVDTGVFHSGVLTALVVDGAEKRLISVRTA